MFGKKYLDDLDVSVNMFATEILLFQLMSR